MSEDFICRFCEECVVATDPTAVQIELRLVTGAMSPDSPVQTIWAHAICTKKHIKIADLEMLVD